MIAPRKSGRRNRAVAGEAARPVSARKNGIRLTWILNLKSSAQRARGPRGRVPSSVAANAVAEHPREASPNPSAALAKRGRRRMEARDAGPPMFPRSRSGQPITPAPPSGDTGIGSAMGWINLNYASPPAFRLVGRAALPCFGDPKGDILRMSCAIGFILAVQRSRSEGWGAGWTLTWTAGSG